MLVDFLKTNKCLKLIAGAGNRDIEEISKLTKMYLEAGFNMFDVALDIDVVKTVREILNNKEAYLCISCVSKGDVHSFKAYFEGSCNGCLMCIKQCPQNAIEKLSNGIKIEEKKCVGCSICANICPLKSIKMQNLNVDIRDALTQEIISCVDCIELHLSDSEDENFKNWEYLNKNFKGVLSISINRLKWGSEKVIQTLKQMLDLRLPYTTIIQADGIPLTGGDDSIKTTLEAVAISNIIKNANLPAYIIVSGGVNSHTSRLLKLCDIKLNGIAFGSFARKLAKEYNYRADENFINKIKEII